MMVYISGPITGVDDYIERFENAESLLRCMSYDSVNPAYVLQPFAKSNASHNDFLQASFRLLEKCDAILMLEGWEKSAGAAAELLYAAQLGLLALEQTSYDKIVWATGNAKSLLEKHSQKVSLK